MIACCIPLTGCFSRLGPAAAEQLPQDIVQFWRGTNLPSRNCSILSSNLLGSRIAQICLSLFIGKIAQFLPAGLLSIEIAQFWAVVSFSTQKLCNPSGKPSQLPPRNAHLWPPSWADCCMCSWVDRFPPGPRKNDFHTWVTSPKATCKGIPCFRDLLLVARGCM